MITVTGHEVDLFRALIADRLGLHLDDGREASVATVLRDRLTATRVGFDAYLRQLERDAGREELRALASHLTVGETYFFRNPDHFRAFTGPVMAERLKTLAPGRRLRLLSAGSSSGDEAHTLAILLREHPGLADWDVTITGIDLNPAAIAKARKGVYSPWSLRETPPEVQARWFRPVGRDFALDVSIRERVTFEERNLVEEAPDFWRENAFDIVFCRNVLMYFPLATAQRVVARIGHSLTPGGYLFLGHAENLRGLTNGFQLCHTDNTFYYQRGEGLPVAVPEAVAEVGDTHTPWNDVIRESAERIAGLTFEEAVTPSPDATQTWDLTEARSLLAAERFGEALALMQTWPTGARSDPDAQLLRAVLLSNSGQAAAAEHVCAELLAADGLNAAAHHVMAMCREHAGDREGAVEHDLKAIHLDPDFAMPRLHLGLITRRLGDATQARQHLEQASVLLAREGVERILLFGGGFQREALARLCRAELVACGGAH